MTTPSTPTARKPRAKKKAAKKKAAAKRPPKKKSATPLLDDPWCGLSEQQVDVLERYLADPRRNATAAWTAAGFGTANDAANRACASRFFHTLKARTYLDRRRRELAERLEVTAEKVMAELAAIAFADPADLMEWDGHDVRVRDSRTVPREARAAVQAVKRRTTQYGTSVEVVLADKRAALDLLGRSLDLWRGGEGDVGPGLVVYMQ